MEVKKQLWDWILQTLFGDNNFDVKKITHLIPPPNLIEKQKLKLCRNIFIQKDGLVHESFIPVRIEMKYNQF